MRTSNPKHRIPAGPLLAVLLAGLLLAALPAFGQAIKVNQAVPPETVQGSTGVIVHVLGENFPSSSRVNYFVSGTTNPGGITVRNVRWVSATDLETTIDVAPDAQTELKFDIVVKAGSRTGKGTELFRVAKRIGTADPQVAYFYGSKIYVCNIDGSNKLVVYENKSAYLRHPEMAPDRRSVYFVEAPLHSPGGIRRVTFDVVAGTVSVTAIETILETPMNWELDLSPAGDRVAFVDGSLYELPICPAPPCSRDDAVLLYTPPANRWVEPVGGYSANGLAYFFFESGEAPEYRREIRRLDLTSTGPPYEAFTVFGFPDDSGGVPRFVQPSPLDYGGLESKLLFNLFDKLYTLETWQGGALSELAGRHGAATWAAADESAIIAVTVVRGSYPLEGPLDMLDAAGHITASVSKWGGGPDWTPLP